MAGEVQDIENNSPHRARGKADFSPAARMLMSIGIGCYLGWQTIDISPTLFPTPLVYMRRLAHGAMPPLPFSCSCCLFSS